MTAILPPSSPDAGAHLAGKRVLVLGMGVAGVSGNGQRELMEALVGQREQTRGTVWIDGERYLASREQNQRLAFNYYGNQQGIPENDSASAFFPWITTPMAASCAIWHRNGSWAIPWKRSCG